MKLTDPEIRKLKIETKPYKVHDGRGLYLEVTPSGGRLWRWAYRFEGSRKRWVWGNTPMYP